MAGKGQYKGGGSLARWRRVVASWRRSGRTQAAFCRARGLNPCYFNRWKREIEALDDGAPKGSTGRLRKDGQNGVRLEQERQRASSTAFIPLSVSPSTGSGAWAFELSTSSGLLVRVRESEVGERVVRALLAEGGASCS